MGVNLQLLHLCEAESISYLDEVASCPQSLDLAKFVVLEVGLHILVDTVYIGLMFYQRLNSVKYLFSGCTNVLFFSIGGEGYRENLVHHNVQGKQEEKPKLNYEKITHKCPYILY